jgi:hypothetical protein
MWPLWSSALTTVQLPVAKIWPTLPFQIDGLPEGSTTLEQIVPDVIGKAFAIVAPSLKSKDRYILKFGVNLVRSTKEQESQGA